jgi:formylglycine-generating enzyme required for sulfatase activity
MNFCFDNETPRHKVYLEPFRISNRPVTCREYLEFMSDDAYARPEFWLSDGWEAVKLAGWEARSIGSVMPAMRRAGASSL